jgi:hypothetical protein
MTSLEHEQALKGGCPHAARMAAQRGDNPGTTIPIRADIEHVSAVAAPPALYTISQVETLMARAHPLAETAQWMRRFLARPHPELGRSGPVCPFVPGAIVQDTIWLTSVPLAGGDRQAIIETVSRFREAFLDLEPKSGDAAMMKAIVIVFPNVATEEASLIDDVQAELKSRFVESGLMIGEFHEQNEGPGLRNPDFRPLRSPIPSLAIRHMVESDLPFLHRMLYPPDVRADFIRSYLRRMASEMSRTNFDAALEALVHAEIELRRL